MKALSTLTVLVLCTISFAKTPQQLKSDIASILPSGKKARLAWTQGGTWSAYSGVDMHLYGVDSDDGIIRKITTGKLRVVNPHITADASRVIFTDDYSGKLYVINWDGTNQKEIATNAYCVAYWRNPSDNSDWALISGDNDVQSPYRRINIDNPTSSVILWNKTPQGQGSPLIGISQDGKRLAAFFGSDHATAGIVNIETNSATVSSFGGCGMGMAPDNSHDYFVHWGEGHHGIRIINGTQSKATINLDSSILVWAHANNNANENNCHNNDEFQDAKWTNDRDYVTFSMFNTKANPFLIRISDKKWIHIYDDIGCGYTHGMDVCFYSAGTSQQTTPRISVADTIKGFVNQTFQTTISVTGNPLPTLSATGLPTGITLKNGTTAATSFIISGTPSSASTNQVTLTAQNSLGSITSKFILVIASQNAAPIVNAGKDTSINKGNAFRLSGTASDDGVPSTLTINWKIISGPTNGAVIALSNELNSSVTFSSVGIFTFELSVSDGAITKKDSVNITIKDQIPFVVNTPNENDQVKQGGALNISWTMDPAGPVTVEVSTDNGKSWKYLVSDSYYETSYIWNIPIDQEIAVNCYIRVSKYHTRSDNVKSGRFSIVSKDASSIIKKNELILIKKSAQYEFFSLSGRHISQNANSKNLRGRNSTSFFKIVKRKTKNLIID